ncbi:MAG: hypothetical protein ABI644_00415 [Arenimonas sp.]
MRLKPILLMLFLGMSAKADAEQYALGFNPRTGDTWMDVQLKDMNVYTRGNMDGFIDDVVISFGAPRPLIREYVVERRWAPGDVYYACALAHQLKVPCINTLRDYDKNNGHGWGLIAKSMGIKPGSAEFQALKGRVSNSNGKFKAKGKYKANQGDGMYRYGTDKPGNSEGDNGRKNGKGKGKKGN